MPSPPGKRSSCDSSCSSSAARSKKSSSSSNTLRGSAVPASASFPGRFFSASSSQLKPPVSSRLGTLRAGVRGDRGGGGGGAANPGLAPEGSQSRSSLSIIAPISSGLNITGRGGANGSGSTAAAAGRGGGAAAGGGGGIAGGETSGGAAGAA